MAMSGGLCARACVDTVFTSASVGAHSVSPHTSCSTADAPSCLFGYDRTTLHCLIQRVGLTEPLSLEAAPHPPPPPRPQLQSGHSDLLSPNMPLLTIAQLHPHIAHT